MTILIALLTCETFSGVSGPNDFLSSGDRNGATFEIAMFDNKWFAVGSANDKGPLVIDHSKLKWPDNSSGKATTYSKQVPLYCPPGQEPSKVSSGTDEVYKCTHCLVDYYSADTGSEACRKCPQGTNCDDVGVAIPCVSPGYWRAEPETAEDLGNFELYKVHQCDIDEACEGGCIFNSTCSSGRDGSSVTCGVCSEGFYRDYLGRCMACGEYPRDNQAQGTLIGTYVGVFFCIGVLFYFYLRISAHKAIKDLWNGGNGTAWHQQQPYVGIKEFLKDSRDKIRENLSSTCKIVLTFLQIMGAFFPLDIHNDRSSSKSFLENFRMYNISPFHGHEGFVECSSATDTPTYYFILLNAFFSPIVVVVLFGMISIAVYFYYSQGESRENYGKLRNLALEIKVAFVRITLWLYLIFYPAVCSIVLSALNCRNFDVSGIWLRVDNSISCEDEAYSGYQAMAIIGVMLYVIGVPIMFWYTIKACDKHANNDGKEASVVWKEATHVLCHHYKDQFIYFEIFQLFRKLMITSISQFVASPSSSSQVIFMLICDLFALIVQLTHAPFNRIADNILSTILTAIEVVSFFLALLIVSGISSEEGYSEVYMYNFWVAIFTLGCFAAACMALLNAILGAEVFSENITLLSAKWFPSVKNTKHDATSQTGEEDDLEKVSFELANGDGKYNIILGDEADE